MGYPFMPRLQASRFNRRGCGVYDFIRSHTVDAGYSLQYVLPLCG